VAHPASCSDRQHGLLDSTPQNRMKGMRKQYHFWPAEFGSGLDAWDVDRLVSLSRALPVQEIDVETIDEIDTVYWFDDTSLPTVRNVVNHMRLINEADHSYPIILSVEGRVMDGMHRVAAALLEGRRTVPAVQFDEPVPPDYRNCRPTDLLK
jgi:hypothetical protein